MPCTAGSCMLLGMELGALPGGLLQRAIQAVTVDVGQGIVRHQVPHAPASLQLLADLGSRRRECRRWGMLSCMVSW